MLHRSGNALSGIDGCVGVGGRRGRSSPPRQQLIEVAKLRVARIRLLTVFMLATIFFWSNSDEAEVGVFVSSVGCRSSRFGI